LGGWRDRGGNRRPGRPECVARQRRLRARRVYRHRGAARARNGDPARGGGGAGARDRDAATQRRDRRRHRAGRHRAAVPAGDLGPAGERRAVGATRHPGGRVLVAAERPRVAAGGQPLYPCERVLPAVPVGRARRAGAMDNHPLRTRAVDGAPERRMTRALHAEWTKLRTSREAWWLLAAAAVLMVTMSGLVTDALPCVNSAAGCDDVVRTSLIGVQVGQAV